MDDNRKVVVTVEGQFDNTQMKQGLQEVSDLAQKTTENLRDVGTSMKDSGKQITDIAGTYDSTFQEFVDAISEAKSGLADMKTTFADMPMLSGMMTQNMQQTSALVTMLEKKLDSINKNHALDPAQRLAQLDTARGLKNELRTMTQLQRAETGALSFKHAQDTVKELYDFYSQSVMKQLDAVTPQLVNLMKTKAAANYHGQDKITQNSAFGIGVQAANDKQIMKIFQQVAPTMDRNDRSKYLGVLAAQTFPHVRLDEYASTAFGRGVDRSRQMQIAQSPEDLLPVSFKSAFANRGYQRRNFSGDNSVLSATAMAQLTDMIAKSPTFAKAIVGTVDPTTGRTLGTLNRNGKIDLANNITKSEFETIRAAVWDQFERRANGSGVGTNVNSIYMRGQTPESNAKIMNTLVNRITSGNTAIALSDLAMIEQIGEATGNWGKSTSSSPIYSTTAPKKNLLDAYGINKYSLFGNKSGTHQRETINESQMTRMLGLDARGHNADATDLISLISLNGFDKNNPEQMKTLKSIFQNGVWFDGNGNMSLSKIDGGTHMIAHATHRDSEGAVIRMISEAARDAYVASEQQFIKENGLRGNAFNLYMGDDPSFGKWEGYGKYRDALNKLWSPTAKTGIDFAGDKKVAIIDLQGKDAEGVDRKYLDGIGYLSDSILPYSMQFRGGGAFKGSLRRLPGDTNRDFAIRAGLATQDEQGNYHWYVRSPNGEMFDAIDYNGFMDASLIKNLDAYKNEDGTWRSATGINALATNMLKHLPIGAMQNYETRDQSASRIGTQMSEYLRFSPELQEMQVQQFLQRMTELQTVEGMKKYVFNNTDTDPLAKALAQPGNDYLLQTDQYQSRVEKYKNSLIQSMLNHEYIDFNGTDIANIEHSMNPMTAFYQAYGIPDNIMQISRGALSKAFGREYSDEEIKDILMLRRSKDANGKTISNVADFSSIDNEMIALGRSPSGWGSNIVARNRAKEMSVIFNALDGNIPEALQDAGFGKDFLERKGIMLGQQDWDSLQGADLDGDMIKRMTGALVKLIADTQAFQEERGAKASNMTGVGHFGWKERTLADGEIIRDVPEYQVQNAIDLSEEGIFMGAADAAARRGNMLNLWNDANLKYIAASLQGSDAYNKLSTLAKKPGVAEFSGVHWDALRLGREVTKYDPSAVLNIDDQARRYLTGEMSDEEKASLTPEMTADWERRFFRASTGNFVDLDALAQQDLMHTNMPSIYNTSQMMGIAALRRAYDLGMVDLAGPQTISEALTHSVNNDAELSKYEHLKNFVQGWQQLFPQLQSGQRGAGLSPEEEAYLEEQLILAQAEVAQSIKQDNNGYALDDKDQIIVGEDGKLVRANTLANDFLKKYGAGLGNHDVFHNYLNTFGASSTRMINAGLTIGEMGTFMNAPGTSIIRTNENTNTATQRKMAESEKAEAAIEQAQAEMAEAKSEVAEAAQETAQQVSKRAEDVTKRYKEEARKLKGETEEGIEAFSDRDWLNMWVDGAVDDMASGKLTLDEAKQQVRDAIDEHGFEIDKSIVDDYIDFVAKPNGPKTGTSSATSSGSTPDVSQMANPADLLKEFISQQNEMTAMVERKQQLSEFGKYLTNQLWKEQRDTNKTSDEQFYESIARQRDSFVKGVDEFVTMAKESEDPAQIKLANELILQRGEFQELFMPSTRNHLTRGGESMLQTIGKFVRGTDESFEKDQDDIEYLNKFVEDRKKAAEAFKDLRRRDNLFSDDKFLDKDDQAAYDKYMEQIDEAAEIRDRGINNIISRGQDRINREAKSDNNFIRKMQKGRHGLSPFESIAQYYEQQESDIDTFIEQKQKTIERIQDLLKDEEKFKPGSEIRNQQEQRIKNLQNALDDAQKVKDGLGEAEALDTQLMQSQMLHNFRHNINGVRDNAITSLITSNIGTIRSMDRYHRSNMYQDLNDAVERQIGLSVNGNTRYVDNFTRTSQMTPAEAIHQRYQDRIAEATQKALQLTQEDKDIKELLDGKTDEHGQAIVDTSTKSGKRLHDMLTEYRKNLSTLRERLQTALTDSIPDLEARDIERAIQDAAFDSETAAMRNSFSADSIRRQVESRSRSIQNHYRGRSALRSEIEWRRGMLDQAYSDEHNYTLQQRDVQKTITDLQRRIADNTNADGTYKDNQTNAQLTQQLTAAQEKYDALATAIRGAKDAQAEFGSSGQQVQAALAVVGQKLTQVTQQFGRRMWQKAIQETKSFVQSFDKSMTDIQMVTLKSDSQIGEIGDSLISSAVKLKAPIKDVTSAATALYRQGLGDDQVQERLEDVIQFSTTAGVKAADAVKLITVAMSSGLVDSAQEAMDVISALGDSAATTAAEITKGLQKSIYAAKDVGVEYSELVAMLTGITANTQLGGNVAGTAMQTLMSRYMKIGTNELIYDENGNAVSGSDLHNLLRSVGIETFVNGERKEFTKALSELSGVWDSLSEARQGQIAYAFGGTRQYSNLSALMTSFADVDENGETAFDKYMRIANSSEGVTNEKYKAYLDSLEASLTNLQNTFDSLVESLTDTGMITGFLDFLSGAISGVKALTDNLGGLGAILSGIAVVAIPLVGMLFGGGLPGLIAGGVTAFGVASAFNKYNSANSGTQTKAQTQSNYEKTKESIAEKNARRDELYQQAVELNKKRDANGNLSDSDFSSLRKVLQELSDMGEISLDPTVSSLAELASSATLTATALNGMKESVDSRNELEKGQLMHVMAAEAQKSVPMAKALTDTLTFSDQDISDARDIVRTLVTVRDLPYSDVGDDNAVLSRFLYSAIDQGLIQIGTHDKSYSDYYKNGQLDKSLYFTDLLDDLGQSSTRVQLLGRLSAILSDVEKGNNYGFERSNESPYDSVRKRATEFFKDTLPENEQQYINDYVDSLIGDMADGVENIDEYINKEWLDETGRPSLEKRIQRLQTLGITYNPNTTATGSSSGLSSGSSDGTDVSTAQNSIISGMYAPIIASQQSMVGSFADYFIRTLTGWENFGFTKQEALSRLNNNVSGIKQYKSQWEALVGNDSTGVLTKATKSLFDSNGKLRDDITDEEYDTFIDALASLSDSYGGTNYRSKSIIGNNVLTNVQKLINGEVKWGNISGTSNQLLNKQYQDDIKAILGDEYYALAQLNPQALDMGIVSSLVDSYMNGTTRFSDSKYAEYASTILDSITTNGYGTFDQEAFKASNNLTQSELDQILAIGNLKELATMSEERLSNGNWDTDSMLNSTKTAIRIAQIQDSDWADQARQSIQDFSGTFAEQINGYSDLITKSDSFKQAQKSLEKIGTDLLQEADIENLAAATNLNLDMENITEMKETIEKTLSQNISNFSNGINEAFSVLLPSGIELVDDMDTDALISQLQGSVNDWMIQTIESLGLVLKDGKFSYDTNNVKSASLSSVANVAMLAMNSRAYTNNKIYDEIVQAGLATINGTGSDNIYDNINLDAAEWIEFQKDNPIVTSLVDQFSKGNISFTDLRNVMSEYTNPNGKRGSSYYQPYLDMLKQNKDDNAFMQTALGEHITEVLSGLDGYEEFVTGVDQAGEKLQASVNAKGLNEFTSWYSQTMSMLDQMGGTDADRRSLYSTFLSNATNYSALRYRRDQIANNRGTSEDYAAIAAFLGGDWDAELVKKNQSGAVDAFDKAMSDVDNAFIEFINTEASAILKTDVSGMDLSAVSEKLKTVGDDISNFLVGLIELYTEGLNATPEEFTSETYKKAVEAARGDTDYSLFSFAQGLLENDINLKDTDQNALNEYMSQLGLDELGRDRFNSNLNALLGDSGYLMMNEALSAGYMDNTMFQEYLRNRMLGTDMSDQYMSSFLDSYIDNSEAFSGFGSLHDMLLAGMNGEGTDSIANALSELFKAPDTSFFGDWIGSLEDGAQILQDLTKGGESAKAAMKALDDSIAKQLVKSMGNLKKDTSQAAETLDALRKGGIDAGKAMANLASKNSWMEDYQKLAGNIAGKSGSQLGSAESRMLQKIFGFGDDKAIKALTKEQVQSLSQNLQEAVNDYAAGEGAETLWGAITDQLQRYADSGNVEQVEVYKNVLFKAIADGEIDASELAEIASAADADISGIIASFEGIIGSLILDIEASGNEIDASWKTAATAEAVGKIVNTMRSYNITGKASGGGGGGGGGGYNNDSGGGGGGGNEKSEAQKLIERQKHGADLYEHQLKMIQYEETRAQNADELTNYGIMLQKEIDLEKAYLPVVEANIKALKEQLSSVEEGGDDWYSLRDAILSAEENYSDITNTIEENNRKLKENQYAIRQTRTALEDMVTNEIQNRIQRQRDMLEGTVSLQDTILEAVKQRYSDEWELQKKDIEKKKEALEEEKSLIDERLQARKDAADEAEKYEELEELKQQLALVQLDSTRTKDAASLRERIADLEKDIGYDIMEKQAESEKKAIDDQIKAYDEYVEKGDEDLEHLLEDANNFTVEINSVLGSSHDELFAWLKNNVDDFKNSLAEAQESMIQTWQDTYNQMTGHTDTFWDEVDRILSSKDSFMDYMKESQDFLNASETEQIQMLYEWEEAYEDMVEAYRNTVQYSHDDDGLGDWYGGEYGRGAASGGGGGDAASTGGGGGSPLDPNQTKQYGVYGSDNLLVNRTINQYDDKNKAKELMSMLVYDDYSVYDINGNLVASQSMADDYDAEYEADVAQEAAEREARDRHNAMGNAIPNAMNAVSNAFDNINKTLSNAVAAQQAKTNVQNAVNNVSNFLNNLVDSAKKSSTSKITIKAATGTYTGDQEGLMYVDKKERVLSARQTAAFEDLVAVAEQMQDSSRFSGVIQSMNAFSTAVNVPNIISDIPSAAMRSSVSNTIGDVIITLNEAKFENDADYEAVAQRVGEQFVNELMKQGIGTSMLGF